VNENKPDAVVSYLDGVIFWGDQAALAEALGGLAGKDAVPRDFDDPVSAVAYSTYIKSFYERGIAEALLRDKPLLLRMKGRDCYAVVDHRQVDDPRLATLKNSVGFRGPGPICGAARELPETFWAEAVRLSLEERAGVLWLLLEPDVWIKPLVQRENAREFLRAHKLKRYNSQASDILSAWIEILLSAVGQRAPVTVTYAPGSAYPAEFTVSTRTAFSRRGAS
jgi:hypothetical protein